jgi:hypothetical protein
MYEVLGSVSFVSDGEISQIQFVTFGEVRTERNVKFRYGL